MWRGGGGCCRPGLSFQKQCVLQSRHPSPRTLQAALKIGVSAGLAVGWLPIFLWKTTGSLSKPDLGTNKIGSSSGSAGGMCHRSPLVAAFPSGLLGF